METFIISFVVIILLVLAMSLILKNTVKTIDDKSKSYFVDKLKQYDYLIDEKEKKLSELEEELEKRKNGLEENKTREGKVTYDFDNSIIDLLTETSYLDKNIFAINKKIEEKFIIDYEDLIRDFLANIKSEHKIYEIFLSSNIFNMEDFIDYLNRLIELNDPTVTILVPNRNVNYDYIDKRIKTKVSDNIYKGIKILYRNKIYDFSLNEGNA